MFKTKELINVPFVHFWNQEQETLFNKCKNNNII